MQRKLANTKQRSVENVNEDGPRRGRTLHTSRGSKNSATAAVVGKSQERSLSQRTFQKMNVVGQSTLMAAHRGSNATVVASRGAGNHHISYTSNNPISQRRSSKKATEKAKAEGTPNRTISPNKTAGQMKTTKS